MLRETWKDRLSCLYLGQKGVYSGYEKSIVEGTTLVELKAVIKLDDAHLAQAINYCHAFNLPSGLLLNFGGKSLEFKRAFNLNYKH